MPYFFNFNQKRNTPVATLMKNYINKKAARWSDIIQLKKITYGTTTEETI